MGGTGGSPPNFLYFTFIYEYFGGWPPVIYCKLAPPSVGTVGGIRDRNVFWYS